jgi:DNA-binding NtrC family response regulator
LPVYGVAHMRDHALSGRSILVVEDEPLIALDIVESLKAAGAEIVTANLLSQALRLAAERRLSAAVLDYRIGTSDSSPICEFLEKRRVPFLIYSGYEVPSHRFPDVPVLGKPATPHRLVTAVADLCAQRRSEEAAEERPAATLEAM